MHFLCSESDIILNKDIFLVFYSSEECIPILNLIFSSIKNIEKYINITCIDVYYFSSIIRRFNIVEVPTFLVFSGGKEKIRISKPLAKNDIEYIIDTILNKQPKDIENVNRC